MTDLTNLVDRLPRWAVSQSLELCTSLRPPLVRTGENQVVQRRTSVISGPELSCEPQEVHDSAQRRLRGGGADPDSATGEHRVGRSRHK